MIRLHTPCKARSLSTQTLDFLLFSQIKMKYDEETMTKKKICRSRVTSVLPLSERLLVNHGPLLRPETHDDPQVLIPSSFGEHVHDPPNLFTAMDPWDTLPESKSLRCFLSARGTNDIFWSIQLYRFLLRIYYVWGWGLEGQSYHERPCRRR